MYHILLDIYRVTLSKFCPGWTEWMQGLHRHTVCPRVEIQMKSNGVKKNFTKLEVLTTILPNEVIEEIKPLLRKQESEFTNNDAYKQVRNPA